MQSAEPPRDAASSVPPPDPQMPGSDQQRLHMQSVLESAAGGLARALELKTRLDAALHTYTRLLDSSRASRQQMARVREQLGVARRTVSDVRASLRTAANYYGRELRRANLPPEKMVILTKTTVWAHLEDGSRVDLQAIADVHTIIEDAVRGAIDGYYAEAG